MIIAFLLAAAPVPGGPVATKPTITDRAALEAVARKCGLHKDALSFVQRKVPAEPVIHVTLAYGDSQAQLDCALQSLPEDFSTRFGIDTQEFPPIR